MVKKICLTAAPGPSVVINWNTRLEYARSSLLSLLLLWLPLPAWLFPLCSLYLDVFFLFFLHPLPHFFLFSLNFSIPPPPPPFSLFSLSSSSNEQLQLCTLLLHVCLSSLERRGLKQRYRQSGRDRRKSGRQTDALKDNDQDAQTVSETEDEKRREMTSCAAPWWRPSQLNTTTNINGCTFWKTSVGQLLVDQQSWGFMICSVQ